MTKLLKLKDIFLSVISIQVLINFLIKKRYLAPYYSIKKKHLVYIFIYFIVRTYGLLKLIISNRGPQFMSEFWQCLYKRLGIKVKLLIVYYLEINGQLKRVNQVRKTYLQSYINYKQDDWAELTPLADFIINNYGSEATKMSPFFINKGFNPRMSFK